MITRKQYMDKEATHREYYGQFVTPKYAKAIAERIGVDRLIASKDPHLNDIPLREWDLLWVPIETKSKLKECDDIWSNSALVCISKEAARQYIESLTDREIAS